MPVGAVVANPTLQDCLLLAVHLSLGAEICLSQVLFGSETVFGCIVVYSDLHGVCCRQFRKGTEMQTSK